MKVIVDNFSNVDLVYRFFWICLSIICLQIDFSKCDFNYPRQDWALKICSVNKSTVDFVGQLCVPLKEGGWKKETIESCKKMLENCPEFNNADCVWSSYILPKEEAGDLLKNCTLKTPLQFPACRLSYKAAIGGNAVKKAWFDIDYVNQYGTTSKDKPFTVVELRRERINRFTECVHPAWPLSVPDPYMEAGKDYRFVELTKIILDNKIAIPKTVCPNGQDTDKSCGQLFADIAIKFDDFWRNRDDTNKAYDVKLGHGIEFLVPECIKSVWKKDGPQLDTCSIKIKNKIKLYDYTYVEWYTATLQIYVVPPDGKPPVDNVTSVKIDPSTKLYTRVYYRRAISKYTMQG